MSTTPSNAVYPPYPGKGGLLWGKGNAFVYRNRCGGLTYRYLAHSNWCEFSLFSEVGESYRVAFDDFFDHYGAPGRIDYSDTPYLADHLRGHYTTC